MTVKESPRVTLFFDGFQEESLAVRRTLEERGENFNSYDIRDLNLAPGDEIKSPTIYSPEGIFEGARQVEVFLRLPSEARVK